ncbi:hypothetical protein EI427_04830 [Flammeovirga pectinis]|uniref:Uncharacterized protein n=1 Tax=Flammeovirga pectinis TaxID=2494373 RepID=A0A3S9P076_9BACT|nr:hypothetical protein [Flammeovirga pectinis]AZQ61576.1 hypothetical protein EI427_04830 [Flammeovirga pectinis]
MRIYYLLLFVIMLFSCDNEIHSDGYYKIFIEEELNDKKVRSYVIYVDSVGRTIKDVNDVFYEYENSTLKIKEGYTFYIDWLSIEGKSKYLTYHYYYSNSLLDSIKTSRRKSILFYSNYPKSELIVTNSYDEKGRRINEIYSNGITMNYLYKDQIMKPYLGEIINDFDTTIVEFNYNRNYNKRFYYDNKINYSAHKPTKIIIDSVNNEFGIYKVVIQKYIIEQNFSKLNYVQTFKLDINYLMKNNIELSNPFIGFNARY